MGVVIIIIANAGLMFHLPTDAFSKGVNTPHNPPLATALEARLDMKANGFWRFGKQHLLM